MEFVHLHLHSDYSLLDGACNITKLVEKAKSLGMRALALTDHGNMFGAVEFYKECLETGIKPIIGIEAYISPGSRYDKTRSDSQEPANHLTILVRNETGYKNLCKLSSLAYKEGFYYKPRMDKELLRQYSDGLMVLSGCPKSEFAQAILAKDEAKAKGVIKEWADIFGKENVFVEIQEHHLEEERLIQHYGEKIAAEMGIELVVTNDVHYIEKEHCKAHDVMLAINTGATISDEERLRYKTPEFYLKTTKDMCSILPKKYHHAIENTLKVAERSNLVLTFGDIHMPRFSKDIPDTQKYLRDLCYASLESKYAGEKEAAVRRLEYELSVIGRLRFADYFLIVQDIVNYARKNGIPVGPGRGSAAGSIVSYLLGITDVDPLRYGLLFERFLNPQRKELPDIDIDFAPEGRTKIINYLKSRYGENNVAQIITFSVMRSRAVIRDVARAMNIENKVADALAKRIPHSQIIDVTISTVLEQDSELRSMIKNNTQLRELIGVSLQLEGLKRHMSKHAAGVVISDRPLVEYCPLLYRDEEEITQFDMDSVQAMGLLKIDILGVDTLSIIDGTLKLIYKRSGKTLSISEIPLDDGKTFELLRKGFVKGVFQLDATKAARELLLDIMPSKVDDLMTAVALNRPGPIQTDMVTQYIEGKKGAAPSFKIPQLKEILSETYGACIYQEQVMMIANKVAGFTMAEADSLRKAMGKKIPELMEEYRDKFIKGAISNKVSRGDAEALFDEIKTFAGYAFNKSHACAYGLISYYTAYLKANYPHEFLAVIMTHNIGNYDKLYEYIMEAKSMGIEVLPPDVNKSDYWVTLEGDKIRLGLGCVRNVSRNAIHEIVTTRKLRAGGQYSDFIDMCEQIDMNAVDKKAVEYLIKSGAFDSIEPNRSFLIGNYERIMRLASKKKERKVTGQLQLFSDMRQMDYPNLDSDTSLTREVLLAFEKDALGFYLRDNPLEKYKDIVEMSPAIPIGDLEGYVGSGRVVVCGVINRVLMKVVHSGVRRGSHYAILRVSDFTGYCEAICFQSTLDRCRKELKEDNVVVIEGRLDRRGDKPSLIASYVENIESYISHKWQFSIKLAAPDDPVIDSLKPLLTPGKGLPVRLQVVDKDRVLGISLGSGYRLEPTKENIAMLKGMAGEVSLLSVNGDSNY